MQLKNVEDIYPLSPMQDSMLFHACTSKMHDVLFNQICFEVVGGLDQSALKQAWQALVDQHAVLRTCFVWQGLKKPQQIVRSQLEIPYKYIDLSDSSTSFIKQSLKDIAKEDKATPFTLEKAPLIRVTLVKINPELHHLIWSSHHLILDRWSIPILFDQLVLCYQAFFEGRSIERANKAQFKHYIHWIQTQNAPEAERFWLNQLSDFGDPNPLTRRNQLESKQDSKLNKHSIDINTQEFSQLKQFCRRNRLTLASLLQGAWALLLNQYTGAQDIVFGIVVSGRPTDLVGVEETLGSFVNNLPVRVKLENESSIIKFLQSAQSCAQKRSPFEYISLSQLRTWCQLAPSQTLFDTILVWLAPTSIASQSSITFKQISADLETAYPFTLTVEEQTTSLSITAILNRNYELIGDLQSLLANLKSILIDLAAATENGQLDNLTGFRKQSASAIYQSLTPANFGVVSEPLNPEQTATKESDRAKLNVGRERITIDAITEFIHVQWQEILAIDDISLDDDFFDIGGDSLKAAVLLTRIEYGFRKKIPLLSLFKGRTVSDMANIILNEDWPLSPQLAIPFNIRGRKPPLFCVASPEVNTIGFANLSHHLDNDLPLYILQAPPDTNHVRQLKASELPELATIYIAAMQQVQSHGPYHILGMCTGAQLSIEIGRQLEANGQKIGFMGVINTWAFFTVSRRYYLQKIVNRFNYYQNRLKTLTLKELKQKLSITLNPKTNRHPEQVYMSQHQEDYTFENPEDLYDNYSLIDDVGWVNLKPDIKKLVAEVTVFRLVKQPYWRISDNSLGWDQQAEQVNVVDVPGEKHNAILREPYIKHIARKLEIILNPSKNKLKHDKSKSALAD